MNVLVERAQVLVQAAQESHTSEMQQSKHHYEGLLARSRTSQVSFADFLVPSAQHESAIVKEVLQYLILNSIIMLGVGFINI